jgi:hypothetical protein
LNAHSSQWSTSNETRDALFACPGFYNEIVTFYDGSSIIVGLGDNNETWMQKISPEGYKQWLPWISVYPAINGLRHFVPDDAGGIYAIIGTQAQRIDKSGALCWDSGGKKIIPYGSLTKIVSDGENGFICLYNHTDSLRRVTLYRYDSTGYRVWEKEIDSCIISNTLTGDITGRLGESILIQLSNGNCKVIQSNGQFRMVDTSYLRSEIFIKESDTSAFTIKVLSIKSDTSWYTSKYQIVSFGNDWILRWANVFEIKDDYNAEHLYVGDPFISDALGNLIYTDSYYDKYDSAFTRLVRLGEKGFINTQEGIIIPGLAGRSFFISKGKIGYVSDLAYAQMVDFDGNKLWSEGVRVIKDVENTAIRHAKSDNQGGAILAFWTIAGGIKVQHTGRVGKTGVLTKVSTVFSNYPTRIELYQNFPNPFNNNTQIKFSVLKESLIQLSIFDAIGREVQQLVNKQLQSGIYEIGWDAKTFSSGIYFCKMVSNEKTSTKKMVLLK